MLFPPKKFSNIHHTTTTNATITILGSEQNWEKWLAIKFTQWNNFRRIDGLNRKTWLRWIINVSCWCVWQRSAVIVKTATYIGRDSQGFFWMERKSVCLNSSLWGWSLVQFRKYFVKYYWQLANWEHHEQLKSWPKKLGTTTLVSLLRSQGYWLNIYRQFSLQPWQYRRLQRVM